MGILKPRGFVKSKKENTLLENAGEIVSIQLEENYDSDLVRVGLMWAGLLSLDEGIPASEVAAMLSCVELVRATTLIDAVDHWTNAAVYAALAYETDPQTEESSDIYGGKSSIEKNPIGFTGIENSESLSSQ